jgi:hypothetical protein
MDRTQRSLSACLCTYRPALIPADQCFRCFAVGAHVAWSAIRLCDFGRFASGGPRSCVAPMIWVVSFGQFARAIRRAPVPTVSPAKIVLGFMRSRLTWRLWTPPPSQAGVADFSSESGIGSFVYPSC